MRPKSSSSDRKSTRLNSIHISISFFFFFFLSGAPPPKLSPLPLHDALPIWIVVFELKLVAARLCETINEAEIIQLRSEEHTSELHSHFHLIFLFFFFKWCAAPQALPSSPPRRSSDLDRRI